MKWAGYTYMLVRARTSYIWTLYISQCYTSMLLRIRKKERDGERKHSANMKTEAEEQIVSPGTVPLCTAAVATQLN